MYTVKEITTFEHVINKSVFICTLFPIKDNNHANEILKEVRKKYYDATHNCYAYIYGLNGEYAKNSDDGEPSQTAGVVILDVLKKNETNFTFKIDLDNKRIYFADDFSGTVEFMYYLTWDENCNMKFVKLIF